MNNGRKIKAPGNGLAQARNSEAHLREIIDAIPTLAWSNLPDGTNEVVNERWREYVGAFPNDARSWSWRAATHPEDLKTATGTWEELLRSGKPGEFEARMRRCDGVFRWFLFRAEPKRNQAGAIVSWYGTATDIEDRKRTEALRAAEMRTLQMIADGASLTDILNHVCTSIDRQISPWMTTILLMDPDGKRLWPSASPRVPDDWVRAISPLPVASDLGLCSTAAFLKRRVIVPDVATEPIFGEEYRDSALKNAIRAGWSQPILTKDNQVLGTFAIYSAEPHVPRDGDLALIEEGGRIALIAIERQRSQEALRNALDQVQRSESTLRQVIDTIPAVAWYGLPDGSKEFLNQRWCDYTGLSREESYGWAWKALVHPQDFPSLREKWLELASSEKAGEFEVRFRRRDGVFRWFLIRVEPFRDETGKLVRWYGASIDIEDLKQAENKLRQDERELRQLIDFLPQHVLVLDKDGTLLQANKTMLDYKGFILDEMKGRRTRDRITRDVHPDDLERVQNERNASLSRGMPFETEKRLLGKDGQYRWFLFRYNPVLNEDGEVVRWFATGTDIEDRKQAEDRMRSEAVALREDIVHSSMFEEIVGSSKGLRQVQAQISRVAPTDSTVLIQGETGTGKELIARAIHNRSNRANRGFICVNCAAIPPSLIASELFGYEKGAFTGALQRRLGRFESADGGTIFLDEVGELPHETQISLLRVLQERELERIGGNRSIHVDVRVLAATNRDLNAAVDEGGFRRDLFYRLNVFPIQVPPLRDRTDDIPVLVDYLVDRYAKKAGKRIRSISKQALQLFQSYSWPGNVRELQNVIERAVILCDGETFSVDPSWLTQPAPSSRATLSLAANLAEGEKAMIENALREANGVISGPAGAAAKLGIPRQTLETKIRKLGINRYRYKAA